MRTIIEKALQEQRLISVCVGKIDWNKRIIGYVKSLGTDYALLEKVDYYGASTKFKKIRLDAISVLETEDGYNRHLERLRKASQFIKKTKNLYYHNKGEQLSKKLLLLKGIVCTIFFGTEYITGIIRKSTDSEVIFDSVGFRGTREGKSICKLEQITKIRYQGALEAKITYLLNNK